MSKFAFPGNSIYNKDGDKRLDTTIFYYGEVVSNYDEIGASRIKARIIGVDDHIFSDDLSYAFPMVQKFLHVIPKVGETVLIFIPDVKNPYIDRMYVGPIISQPQMLKGDTQPFSSKSALSSGIREPNESPNTVPENKGVYPNTNDISLQGRDNSQIILKDREVLLRAGQFDVNVTAGEIPKFNKINSGYIQIKHDVTLKPETETTTAERGSAINVVANKINLLTHKNGAPRFVLNDQDETITTKELQKILEDAHPLVFGDNLIEYLKLLKDAFLSHVHPYPGMKPQDLSGTNAIAKYREYNLNSMLSKNIRIN